MQGQEEGSVSPTGWAKSKQPFLAALRVTSVAGPVGPREGRRCGRQCGTGELSLEGSLLTSLGSIPSSTCWAPPLPHPSPHDKAVPAHPGLLAPGAWHHTSRSASCFLLSYPHIAKQIPQPDFRQKPCLSGSPRQMNSEFSMPGKAQRASTHAASPPPAPSQRRTLVHNDI